MTQALFREDAYQAETEATVLLSEPRGIALDRTVFYPQGGGQSGDRGALVLEDGTVLPIVNTIYDSDRATILHVPAEGAPLPRLATRVRRASMSLMSRCSIPSSERLVLFPAAR